jgi:hypothetical protein
MADDCSTGCSSRDAGDAHRRQRTSTLASAVVTRLACRREDTLSLIDMHTTPAATAAASLKVLGRFDIKHSWVSTPHL